MAAETTQGPDDGGAAPQSPRTVAMDPFAALDATAQGALAASGQVAPIELVDAAIARIEALDGDVNAVCWRGFERAREQARALEGADGPKGAFHGVPFLVKDLAALEGAPLTFGSRFFQSNVATSSEPSVQASLSTGLIPVGKTSTPEFGLLGGTEPTLFGPTRNPWDLERSPGGSSGGAAAAVASGMTPIAGAGDGGGSIRIPASCCGVFGLKPSRARAIAPLRAAPGDLSVHLGVSRSVRDSARLLEACERRGVTADMAPIGFIDGPSKRRLRIALGRRAVTGALPEPEVQRALEEVAALCEALGHTVVEAEPDFDRSQSVERFLGFWAGVPDMLMRNLLFLRLKVWNWRPTEDEFEAWTLGLADWFQLQREREGDVIGKSRAFFDEVAQVYAKFFTAYDVLLTPVLRSLPVRVGEHAPTIPFDELLPKVVDYVGYTPVFNAIGAPAMSVPLSTSASGLPIGAHFGAGVGEEAMLLALAYELEEARPWADRWPSTSAVRLIS